MNKFLAALAGAAFLLSAPAAHAVSIVNGSFELGTNPGPGFLTLAAGSNAITGWTVGGAGVDYIGGHWQASEGSRSLDLSALDAGSVSQTLTGLTAGKEYKVSFDLAANPAGSANTLVTVSAASASKDFHFSPVGHTTSNMGWATQVFLFVADGTSDTLTFLSGTHSATGPALDNVRIAATPLPPAILLFGTALAGMGFLGRRRQAA